MKTPSAHFCFYYELFFSDGSKVEFGNVSKYGALNAQNFLYSHGIRLSAKKILKSVNKRVYLISTLPNYGVLSDILVLKIVNEWYRIREVVGVRFVFFRVK
jgi:hypothetical protein